MAFLNENCGFNRTASRYVAGGKNLRGGRTLTRDRSSRNGQQPSSTRRQSQPGVTGPGSPRTSLFVLVNLDTVVELSKLLRSQEGLHKSSIKVWTTLLSPNWQRRLPSLNDVRGIRRSHSRISQRICTKWKSASLRFKRPRYVPASAAYQD